MRALLMKDKQLRVGDIASPEPLNGQVLVRTLSCGICASDIHLLSHGERLATWSREFGGPFRMDMSRDIVMGHEFCGEVLDYGPGSSRPVPTGKRVTSVPTLATRTQFAVLGYDNEFPGGFAEQMILDENLIRPVPDGLSNDEAALTEPVSVGHTYIRISQIRARDVALVVGCGAIGLAIISALRQVGVSLVVASDFSSFRRELALAAGAHEVVDPAGEEPFRAWAVASGRKKGGTPFVFECVGVPGVLGEILNAAPWGARVVVAGVCLEPDSIFAASAHTKSLNVQFGGTPTPDDFDKALRSLGDGTIDVKRWITGTANLASGTRAFDWARDTNTHARVMVRPTEDGSEGSS